MLACASCQVMIGLQKINWKHWRFLLTEYWRFNVKWFILMNNLRQSVLWILLFVLRRILLFFVLWFFLCFSCFLWLAWFISVICRGNIQYFFDYKTIIFKFLVIFFTIESQFFKDVIQLFWVDFGSHSIILSPFREEIFKTRTNLLTIIQEHVIWCKFIKWLLREISTE